MNFRTSPSAGGLGLVDHVENQVQYAPRAAGSKCGLNGVMAATLPYVVGGATSNLLHACPGRARFMLAAAAERQIESPSDYLSSGARCVKSGFRKQFSDPDRLAACVLAPVFDSGEPVTRSLLAARQSLPAWRRVLEGEYARGQNKAPHPTVGAWRR